MRWGCRRRRGRGVRRRAWIPRDGCFEHVAGSPHCVCVCTVLTQRLGRAAIGPGRRSRVLWRCVARCQITGCLVNGAGAGSVRVCAGRGETAQSSFGDGRLGPKLLPTGLGVFLGLPHAEGASLPPEIPKRERGRAGPGHHVGADRCCCRDCRGVVRKKQQGRRIYSGVWGALDPVCG